MPKEDPLDLKALEASKAAADEETKRARQIEMDDFRWLMKQKQGRRIVWRLLEKAGNYRTSLDSDVIQMAGKEGARNLGLMLIAEIHELCPEQIPAMIKEQQDYGRSSSERRNTGSTSST